MIRYKKELIDCRVGKGEGKGIKKICENKVERKVEVEKDIQKPKKKKSIGRLRYMRCDDECDKQTYTSFFLRKVQQSLKKTNSNMKSKNPTDIFLGF